MKKSELKAIKKNAKKILKNNLEENLLAAIKQTAAKWGADTKKTEKRLGKSINKLTKRIIKLITPAKPKPIEPAKIMTSTPAVRVSKTAPEKATNSELITAS